MPRKKISITAILVSLWLLAFAARLITFHEVFSPAPFADGSRISVYGDDPPYHVRRIGLTMQSFPWVPYYDTYMAYPSGWRSAYWPPLFDWPIACAAKALGYSPRDQEAWLRLVVYVPPLLGAFTVLIAYLIARRFMDDTQALVSAAVFAVFPGHILYSLLGRVDHHVAEMLAGLMMVLFLLKGLEKIESTQRVSWPLAAACGAAAAWSLATSLGSLALITLVVAFVPILAAVETARSGRADPSAPLFRFGWIAFLSAFLLLIPLCWHSARLEDRPEAYAGLSWAYLYLIGAPAVVFFVLEKICRAGRPKWRPYLTVPALTVGLAALVIATTALVFPSLLAPIGLVGGYVAKSDAWSRVISETQPLFFDRGIFHREYPEMLLTRFVYLYPLFVIVLFIVRLRTKGRSSALDFFLYWSAAMLLMGFAKKRFVYFMALNMSLALGWALVGIVRRLRRECAGGVSFPRRQAALRAAGMAGLAACCLFACYPSLYFFLPVSKHWRVGGVPFFACPAPLRATFAWIRDHTPPTRFYMAPERRPEYGVICMPDYAMWLVFYAQRPSVAGPWFTLHSAERERTSDVFRFLLAEDEARANDLADRNDVRYIVTSPIVFGLRDFAAVAGLDPDRTMKVIRDPATGKLVERITDIEWYDRLIANRLYERDGVSPLMAPTTLPPTLRRYRLLYESEPFRPLGTANLACLKVFEYVKGARLVGQTMPHATVRAETSILTNQGRGFTYQSGVEADEQGRFTLTVPYATVARPRETRPVSKYRVNALAVDVLADVSEQDVLRGQEVKIVFPQKQITP